MLNKIKKLHNLNYAINKESKTIKKKDLMYKT